METKDKYVMPETQREAIRAKLLATHAAHPEIAVIASIKRSASTQSKINIKRYRITDADGNVYITEHGLNQFCREHGLNASCMIGTITGEQRAHKGWKAERID